MNQLAPILVAVDYDRTLFDAGRFGPAVIQAAEDLYKVRLTSFKTQLQATSQGFGYEPFVDLEAAGVPTDMAFTDLSRRLNIKQFLFADSLPFLEHLGSHPGLDIHIVTVGSPRYQQLKLLPITTAYPHLPVHIIGLNKGAWLAQAWADTELRSHGPARLNFHGKSYRSAILVDDRSESFADLHNHPLVKGIHIVRPEAKYQERHPGTQVVSSLGQATALIDEYRLR